MKQTRGILEIPSTPVVTARLSAIGKAHFTFDAGVLQVSADGAPYVPVHGAGSVPGAPVDSVQFNGAGAFAGDPSLLFAAGELTATGVINADGGIDSSGAAPLDIGRTNANAINIGSQAGATNNEVPLNLSGAWAVNTGSAPGNGLLFIDTTTGSELFAIGDAGRPVDVLSIIGNWSIIGATANVAFSPIAADPTPTIAATLYAKTDGGGVQQLFAIASDGTVTQLTPVSTFGTNPLVIPLAPGIGNYQILDSGSATPYLRIDTDPLARFVVWDRASTHTWHVPDGQSSAFSVDVLAGGIGEMFAISTIGVGLIAIGNATKDPPVRILGSGGLTVGFSGTDTGFVRIRQQTVGVPATDASSGALFTSTEGGVVELHYLDGTGQNTRVTRSGRVNIGISAGAYTVTNPVVDRAFDTTTVNVQGLAEVVGTLLLDLGIT